jgi:hypothetical protein
MLQPRAFRDALGDHGHLSGRHAQLLNTRTSPSRRASQTASACFSGIGPAQQKGERVCPLAPMRRRRDVSAWIIQGPCQRPARLQNGQLTGISRLCGKWRSDGPPPPCSPRCHAEMNLCAARKIGPHAMRTGMPRSVTHISAVAAEYREERRDGRGRCCWCFTWRARLARKVATSPSSPPSPWWWRAGARPHSPAPSRRRCRPSPRGARC